MQSTLFTTLTATEEASLSGGHKKKTTTPPATTPPATTPPATPPAPPTITVNLAAIITQTAVNVNTGYVKGDLTQTAVNQIKV
ncbi:MAG: hypothetical protein V7L20_14590 [Nostoc sp.]|uniref:hypothetical protein n=1 Tax=Nostoc sp. TaxID=1180 RepID=UPI002FFB83E1